MSTAGVADLTASYYWRLRGDILDAVFPAGTPLKETTLAGHYGVSRTPIREALALLEHDGLIERVSRGFRVRRGSPQSVLEVYEARLALEPAVAAAAAQRRNDLDLAQLGRLQALAEQADAPAQWRRLQAHWHEHLWLAGHNAVMLSALTRMVAQLRLFDHGEPPPSGDYAASNADHAVILQAVQRQDADQARQAMAEHLTRSRQDRLAEMTQG